MKDTSRSSEEAVNVHLGRKTVLASELENKRAEYCVIMNPKSLWTETLGHKTHGFSVGNKKWFETSIYQKNSEAGKKQLRSFLQRHPVISMRTPEGISAARVKGFTSENVASFFFLTSMNLN